MIGALVAAATIASCTPTADDGFGPFGRGIPPVRSSFGSGHVLTGVVLSTSCRRLRRARVEVWQAGRGGRYTRAGSATVFTGADGRFRVVGPRPTSYEALTPHIHLRVTARDHQTLVTRVIVPPGTKRTTVRLVLRPIAL